MADFSTRELRAWAVKGAEQRLVELAAEAAAIHRAFPELREQGGGGGSRGTGRSSNGAAPEAEAAAPSPRRRTISAEGRRRIAEAQRKRWAEHRQQAAAQPAGENAGENQAPSGRARKKR